MNPASIVAASLAVASLKHCVDRPGCRYRYSGTSWPNMVMPPWFVELTDEAYVVCLTVEQHYLIQ